jgi:hypothetical protein
MLYQRMERTPWSSTVQYCSLFNTYVPGKDIPPCGKCVLVFSQILGVCIVAIITFHEANMRRGGKTVHVVFKYISRSL